VPTAPPMYYIGGTAVTGSCACKEVCAVGQEMPKREKGKGKGKMASKDMLRSGYGLWQSSVCSVAYRLLGSLGRKGRMLTP
jgi:hypothetical protein